MFTDFKSQFLYCIVCTFITGVLIGITASFVEFNQPIKETFIFGCISLFSIVLTILFWNNIFHRLKFRDKIYKLNSIYTDID
jgi:ABC-type uncharacterized transport system permease subunit